jgi:hypothetical protein
MKKMKEQMLCSWMLLKLCSRLTREVFTLRAEGSNGKEDSSIPAHEWRLSPPAVRQHKACYRPDE